MLEVERYYRILDLKPGASPEEVHQGYLDLTWVWHPDRFTGHPRLQQKAQCKLQELNEAHDRLRSCRPISQTKDLRAPTKSQVAPPSYDQPPVDRWSKGTVNRTWVGENTRTTKDYQQTVSFKKRDVDEWLD